MMLMKDRVAKMSVLQPETQQAPTSLGNPYVLLVYYLFSNSLPGFFKTHLAFLLSAGQLRNLSLDSRKSLVTMTENPEGTPVMGTESGGKGSVATEVRNEKDIILADDESKYITGRKLYLINASLLVSIFLTSTESTIIATALVDITNDLGGYGKSSWLFTAYMLTYCSTLNNIPNPMLR
jgi:hypothetical protein